MASTLAQLFAPGQRIPELDDADLNELADLVLEELGRRKGLDVKLVGRTRAAGADPTPVPALEWEDI